MHTIYGFDTGAWETISRGRFKHMPRIPWVRDHMPGVGNSSPRLLTLTRECNCHQMALDWMSPPYNGGWSGLVTLALSLSQKWEQRLAWARWRPFPWVPACHPMPSLGVGIFKLQHGPGVDTTTHGKMFAVSIQHVLTTLSVLNLDLCWTVSVESTLRQKRNKKNLVRKSFSGGRTNLGKFTSHSMSLWWKKIPAKHVYPLTLQSKEEVLYRTVKLHWTEKWDAFSLLHVFDLPLTNVQRFLHVSEVQHFCLRCWQLWLMM